MRTALCPGSYDPIHNGHLEVIEPAAKLFDRVVVAVIRNPGKVKPMFTLEERKDMVHESLGHLPNVDVTMMKKLTVDVAKDVGAGLDRARPTGRVGLRVRVADGADERGHLRHRDDLHSVRVDQFVHRVVARSPDRTGRRSRATEIDGAGAGVEATEGEIHRVSYDPTAMANEPPDAETLLRRVVDIVNNAKSMPLSSSVLLSNKDDVLELMEDALERLPAELRQARWMLRERQEFLDKVQREGDEILEAARVRAERMVQRTEIVREAQHVAEKTVEEARELARRLRHEAEDYCDQKLAAFEIVLERTAKTVQGGREKLRVTPSGPHRGRDRLRRRRT